MVSQWERLLKNQGTWVGSFTQLTAAGEPISDVPTEVSLKALSRGELVRQEIRKFPANAPPQETVLEYRSLNRSVLLFEQGAFSQGSLQWSPLAEFGAELGLIYARERLRLVETYPRQRTLGSVTLIREHLQGDSAPSRPHLSADQLLGHWQGEATTLYPDWRPATTDRTRLAVSQVDDQVQQCLTIGDHAPLQSAGQLQGHRISFRQWPQPVTVLLLPGGASATFPTEIVSGQPFFLEAGWLIHPDYRQRMVRSYSAQGTWMSLTLVTERRVG